ncbi:MAG: TonB-dependent receptor [Flavobacterium sp.]
MFLNRCFSLLLIGCSASVFAQETEVDPLTENQLKDVVVTAQFGPQSIRKAVNNVRVITKADLQKLAANNLSDVLDQYLNITISPDSETGRSTAQLFQLDGSYFKILVDNVPIVSDTSMGNNIDLTQINLDDIEQIEIIEGSMGVTHGAGAVSGILNIITKKNAKHKWEIGVTAQEETMGEEYAAFNKGKHIQSLKISNKITDNWFASIGLNRNDSGGYLDNRKGPDYAVTDGLRGYAWLPKLQYFGNGMLSYRKNDFQAFYKFDYMNENIDFYNTTILAITNPPFGTTLYAKDKRYKTERFYHHLNVIGSLFSLKYNVSLSHQTQTRDTEDFDYYFATHTEQNNKNTRFQEAKVLYSTGTLSNFFKNSIADLQVGYEAVNNKAYAFLEQENQVFKVVEKRFENYDFFVASEIKVNDRLLVRPGIRISLQSQFDTQNATSFGLRYLFNNDIEVRASMGKSYRVPTFEELYSKIKFSGHNFYGNENLIPEKSNSLDLNIRKTSGFASGARLTNQVSVGYIDVEDRIDMAYIGFEPGTTSPVYQYINISDYKMWNIATTNQFNYKNWNATAGFVYAGISRLIDNGEVKSDDKFYFNFQANASLSYEWKKAATMFAVYYKLYGLQQQFSGVVVDNQYVLTEIESYSLLHASIKKSFFKKQFDLTVGARNLFDVTRLNQGDVTGGAHSTAADLLIGYGRSYFIKLAYNLNF